MGIKASRKSRVLFRFVIICVVLFVSGFIYVQVRIKPYQPIERIFLKVDELNVLNPKIIDKAVDENIEGFEYREAFCYDVEHNGDIFTVLAYEFFDDDVADKYFYFSTGQTHFFGFGTMLKSDIWKTRYCVSYGSNVLCVIGKNYQKTIEFINWFSPSLTIEISDLEDDLMEADDETIKEDMLKSLENAKKWEKEKNSR